MEEIKTLISKNVASLSDGQVAEVLDLLPSLEKWIKEFKAQALSNSLDTGVVYPGYQLKEYSRRRISDDGKVAENIRQFDLELFSQCVKIQPFTHLQRIMGEHLFERFVAPYIVVDKSYRLVKDK
ncbi:MAG: DUF2800 domain-containing protein [Bacteroidaceae bacterium]|nr:DUF2800 domain-containing protein [Bacteroidaceae bacterium]